MLLVLWLGLGLLAYLVTYAVSWFLVLLAPGWMAAVVGGFCALTAAAFIAGSVPYIPSGASRGRAGRSSLLGAWVGTVLGLVWFVTSRDVETAGSVFLWGLMAAAVGTVTGSLASLRKSL